MKADTCFQVIPYIHFRVIGALSAHINGDHDYVSRYKSYYQKDEMSWISEKILLRRRA